MRKRGAIALGAGAAAVAALAAHAVYWYQPRERAARLSTPASALFADPAWEDALWVPFPHQNLGQLEARVGDLRRWLALVAPAGEVAADRLPSFGPWLVPPARELVAARRGEALTVELAVYPTIRLLARASGRLAGNPWLAGGEVALGRGRRARVAWVDGRWRLTTAIAAREPAAAAAADAAAESPPAGWSALAWIRLRRPLGWLPGGLYRVERGALGLELVSGLAPAAPPPLGAGESAPAAWRIERSAPRGVTATVVWPDLGAMPPFPVAVTFERGRTSRRRLPGEELLRLAGGEPARGEAAGFTLRALAAAEVERGAAVAGEVAALLAERPGLQLYAGLRPDRFEVAARRIAERFRGLPVGLLLGAPPERLRALLAPLAGCPLSTLEVWQQPTAARWRICLAEPAGDAEPGPGPDRPR